MNKKTIETTLDNLYSDYYERIEAVANNVFLEHIKDYLQKNKITFINGGAWGSAFYDENMDGISEDSLPNKIKEYLDIRVNDFYLSDFMEDFRPE